ncbi:MAG: oligopeptide/dipeptide ABC transporter ATP-binding protein [Pseudomonadota bacterium]
MTLLSIRNLSVTPRPDRPGEHPLDSLDLDIAQGEHVALVGGAHQGPASLKALLSEPGLAKSRVEAGTVWLEVPDQGRLTLWRLLVKERGAIWAPDSAMFLGKGKKRTGARAASLLTQLGRHSAEKRLQEGLRRFNSVDPHGLLSKPADALDAGERMIVSLAMIAAVSPRILLLADPTVADPVLWARYVRELRLLTEETGMAVLFQTSDLVRAAELCQKTVVFYAGRVVEEGDAASLRDHPQHPLTSYLGKCLPEAVPSKTPFPIDGRSAPTPGNVPTGCPFHPRCARALAGCYVEPPEFSGTSSHRWACHRPMATGL